MNDPGHGITIKLLHSLKKEDIYSHCLNFPRDIPKIVLPLDNGSPEMFAFGLFSPLALMTIHRIHFFFVADIIGYV